MSSVYGSRWMGSVVFQILSSPLPTSHLTLLHIPQVVLLLVLIFLWKLVDNRRKKTSSTTTAKSNSNSKEDHHPQLPLPYPQPPSDTYEDIVSTKELGPDSCKCGSNIPKCSFFFFIFFFFPQILFP